MNHTQVDGNYVVKTKISRPRSHNVYGCHRTLDVKVSLYRRRFLFFPALVKQQVVRVEDGIVEAERQAVSQESLMWEHAEEDHERRTLP